MELTIDHALQKGIEAHKAGQVQDADRLYSFILKAQPKHADANHNMGVLAVGIGKVQEALPFFKTALETNSNTAQFWLSYIDALIKLNRLAEAKAVLDQAKSNGSRGDGFGQIEDKLSQTALESSFLNTAIQLRESGKIDKAIDLLKDGVKQFSENADMFALLSHCCILNNDLDVASINLDKAKAIDPFRASIGWNEARLLLKNSSVDAAVVVARNTNKSFPDDVEGMGVLGSCLRANNDLGESLVFLNKAIELNPNYAEALINRGLIRLNQKETVGALADLEKAHKLKPNIKQIWDLLVGLKVGAEQYSETILLLINMIEIDPNREASFTLLAACNQKVDDIALAEKSFKKILEFKPDDVTTLLNLGIIFEKRADFDAAIEFYRKSLSIRPNYAEAHYNIGNALQKQGNLEEATGAYKKALSIRPNYAEAFNNMGNALRNQGKLEGAIGAYKNAISFKTNFVEAYGNMAQVLKNLIFTKPNPKMLRVITSILDHKTDVRPKDISKPAISLLKFEPPLVEVLRRHSKGELNQSLQEAISNLSRLPLLLKLMNVCPLADLELEAILIKIRSGLLFSISGIVGSPETLRFQSALALQCFTNEYVYKHTVGEVEAVQLLAAVVGQNLANGQQPSPTSILCLATYRALHEYEWCDLLTITSDTEKVFTRQVLEPEQEVGLKPGIPTLEGITNKVSTKVKEQYEENPYPRWVNLALSLRHIPISLRVKEASLKLFDPAISRIEFPNILVAGCGTGQHPIGTASTLKGSKIFAIDLSLTSLAYAKRKTDELGIKNIEYMQADILDLGKLDRRFDIIESSGVLHHMADPLGGWRVLTDCLEPGGLMRIGLYSALARRNIVKLRNEIKRSGIGSSDIEMRSFRDTVITSDKEHHKQILNSDDFYSLSSLRDLLFHTQEHRFTIPQLKECLFELGLKFCGFEHREVVRDFKLSNTRPDDAYDLDIWNVYEETNPSVFQGMYQFWCQKVV